MCNFTYTTISLGSLPEDIEDIYRSFKPNGNSLLIWLMSLSYRVLNQQNIVQTSLRLSLKRTWKGTHNNGCLPCKGILQHKKHIM